MDMAPRTAVLRLLTDPTRARMLSLILGSQNARATVTRLAEMLELTQPTVSHHVKVLLDEGVLRRDPEGRQAWYSIAPEHLDQVSELLQTPVPQVERAVLERIGRDLAHRFTGVFSPETVERYVEESYELLAGQARITRYLPSLTARFTGERLTALARAQHTPGGAPEVLFVCVQNAGRSQMAAAILRHLAGDRVHVRSAGSQPAAAVRSVIVSVLDEIGVPIGGEFPKPLTDEVVRAADVVITMGCGDACPVYPGRRYLDWELEDPVGLPVPRVREIRDEIEIRVRELLNVLGVLAGGSAVDDA
ncbi:metalloregulator ArsR/SmtB family transcription factor [Luethyella okanaganae]|uniref:Metalloregulator ArsR/SmtB family transcription factor n=1 Tax=Luethyella okanaganae TaxID=69372 RepID=A0ABW1VA35_9MICO